MPKTNKSSKQDVCRLCAGNTEKVFSLTVLGKHDASFLKCTNCESLQSEEPYWLDEAYSLHKDSDADGYINLNSFDTGAAQRNLRNASAVVAVAKLLSLKDIVDQGGGDGLLCRLTRDYGLNSYVRDQYANATYAQGFDAPPFETPEMITAFEVFEHYSRPDEEIAKLFDQNPAALLITTGVYTDQGPDWWYLIPETGQHIFFYSEKAFAFIAKKFDRDLVRCGQYTLFVQKGRSTPFKRKLLRLALRMKLLRVSQAVMAFHSAGGVQADLRSIRG